MRRAIYTAVFAAIFCLLFPGCDIFNAPLKDFIKDATGRTEGLGHVILTDHYMRADGTAAIPPADVSEHTIINVFLSNEQNYYLHITLTGEGSENAGFTLSNDRRTILVTLLNQPREVDSVYVFDLTLNMTANDRPMPSVKLPRMECRYLDDSLEELSVSSPGNIAFSPDTTTYAVNLPRGTSAITLSGILPIFGKCLIQDIEKYWTDDDHGFTYEIPVQDGVSSTVPIRVIADSGKTKDYFILITELGSQGNIWNVTFNENYQEGSSLTQLVMHGATFGVSLPVPSRTGYTFIGWNIQADGSGTSFTATTAVTEHITVYAQWKIDFFTSIAAFQAWLDVQPATTTKPYVVKLNINDLTGIATVLNANSAKYVDIDLSGSTITSIPDRVFGGNDWNGCPTLTGITIPDSVTSIGSNAFRNCTSLTSITIPDSVTSIGGSAFFCTNLTSVTIPNSVTSIGGSAFAICTNLTSVTIPNSVTSIGGSAFLGCTSLTSVTIPDSVTSIGDDTFHGCTKLISITIPDSVTSIGGGAFENCTSLTGVTIPDSVTSIGGSAFAGCTSLTGVTIPNSVTSIGGSAFAGCTSLTSVTFAPGSKITSIGYGAFRNCTKLISITIPNRVTSIGGNYSQGCDTFHGCTSLTSINVDPANTHYSSVDGVLYDINKTFLITYPAEKTGTTFTIPNSVVFISYGINDVYYAFSYCTNLTSINVDPASTAFSSVDGVLYDKDKTTLVAYPGGKEGAFTIPNSVTRIGGSAFHGCTSLTSIIIPDSVTSIGQFAFYDCYRLTNVTIGSGVTSISAGVFYCNNLTSVTFNCTISSANFPNILNAPSFPGDLRNKYFATNGGIGTYTTTNPGDSAVWTKN